MHKLAIQFLTQLFTLIEKHSVQIHDWKIDHVCYRTSDESHYQETKKIFSKLGELLIESDVNGRLISTYKLFEPILFRDYVIPLVEVPTPKIGKNTIAGFEHAEFVTNITFEEIENQNPHLSFDKKGTFKSVNPELAVSLGEFAIKFHQQSLEQVIEFEKNHL